MKVSRQVAMVASPPDSLSLLAQRGRPCVWWTGALSACGSSPRGTSRKAPAVEHRSAWS